MRSSPQPYLATHESVAYAHICSIKEERGREGGGWGPLYSGGGGGGTEGGREELLCEAHNLIIQSIEQHIHFIVLQISSPNPAASSEEKRSPCAVA